MGTEGVGTDVLGTDGAERFYTIEGYSDFSLFEKC